MHHEPRSHIDQYTAAQHQELAHLASAEHHMQKIISFRKKQNGIEITRKLRRTLTSDSVSGRDLNILVVRDGKTAAKQNQIRRLHQIRKPLLARLVKNRGGIRVLQPARAEAANAEVNRQNVQEIQMSALFPDVDARATANIEVAAKTFASVPPEMSDIMSIVLKRCIIGDRSIDANADSQMTSFGREDRRWCSALVSLSGSVSVFVTTM
jgi:hypothetical protein